jgi:hypothetical protein
MKARWRSGNIIRNKESGEAYFVLHVYPGVCTLVLKASSGSQISLPGILMKRDYTYFSLDIEMELTKHDLITEALSWKHSPLPKIKEK